MEIVKSVSSAVTAKTPGGGRPADVVSSAVSNRIFTTDPVSRKWLLASRMLLSGWHVMDSSCGVAVGAASSWGRYP